MKNTILLACFMLVLTGITLLVQAGEETVASKLHHTMSGEEEKGEKDCPAEEVDGLKYYGTVAEQVFTLQTGAKPFEKLKETLLNL